MEKEQGLQIIEQALNLANAKGVFKLEESATIFTAFITVKNALQPVEVETKTK
jgi:hypothetical protein